MPELRGDQGSGVRRVGCRMRPPQDESMVDAILEERFDPEDERTEDEEVPPWPV